MADEPISQLQVATDRVRRNVPESLQDPLKLANAAMEAAWSKNAYGTMLLDVGAVAGFTDVFLILTGRSDRHAKAVADAIEKDLKERGLTPIGVEGRQAGTWILLDYGSVIVHVFEKQTRDFYELERLWSDARMIPVEEPPWVKEFARMEAGEEYRD